jgi:uncharacterized protein YkwD
MCITIFNFIMIKSTFNNYILMSFDYQGLKNETYEEINRIRRDPSSYIPILEQELNYFKDNVLFRPNYVPLQTTEGSKAYLAAIEFLRSRKSISGLSVNEYLERAAASHAIDSGENNLVSHEGSDGKNVSDRIEENCEWEGSCGENIDFGGRSGQEVVISMLVDDGCYDKPHRWHLFNPSYKYCGVGVAAHKLHEVVVVIDFVVNIRSKGSSFFDYDNYKYDYNQDFKKDRVIKNAFQVDDVDAPDDTKSVRTEKAIKTYKGRQVKVTKKIYSLNSGITHIVEVEDY